jgi:hypothetical protein
VLLLERVTLKEARIYSQESRMKVEDLEREEGAQALNLKEYSHFSEWSTAQGGRWGSIYKPPPQKSRWRNLSSDKSGGPL